MKFKLNRNTQIIFKKECYSYRELCKQQEGIFEQLRALKLQKADTVALMMSSTPTMLLTILSLLELGIPFLNMDRNQPEERRQYMLDTADITVVISDSGMEYLPDRDVILQKRKKTITGKEAAYILFTSGSTGKPKGVEVTREGFENFLEGIPKVIPMREKMTLATFTTYTFDIFFLETVLSMLQGLTIVLADEEERKNPLKMIRLIKDNGVDMIQMTPSRMKMLLLADRNGSFLENLQVILLGGEAFPLQILKTLQEKSTARLFNMYGPTETTIWSTVAELTVEDEIHIGMPIQNTDIYILDENMQEVPIGEVGEICIGGMGLANGYRAREDLTQKAFVEVEHLENQRIYKTGDLGCFDGVFYYCKGRIDNQLKVNGFRMEPEEIEYHINSMEGIKESVVFLNDRNALSVLYVADSEVETGTFRAYLGEHLPEYMIPSHYRRTDALYYTANGKLDRRGSAAQLEKKELPEAGPEKSSASNHFSEQDLFRILTELSGEEVIQADGALNEIITDSIMYVDMIVQIEEIYGISFDDDVMLDDYFQTVNDLCEYVNGLIKAKRNEG